MKVKILTLLTGFIVSSGLALADQHPMSPEAIKNLPLQQQQCRVCHQAVTPEVYKQWANSKHAVANVRCFQCHGTFEDFHKIPPIEKCAACHFEEVETMKQKAPSMPGMPGMKCWTCHTAHVFQFHGKGVGKTKSAKDFGIK
ncbi:MAG: multiheme c-type cytochrome [Desulfurobacteriaceae bacterium]